MLHTKSRLTLYLLNIYVFILCYGKYSLLSFAKDFCMQSQVTSNDLLDRFKIVFLQKFIDTNMNNSEKSIYFVQLCTLDKVKKKHIAQEEILRKI